MPCSPSNKDDPEQLGALKGVDNHLAGAYNRC